MRDFLMKHFPLNADVQVWGGGRLHGKGGGGRRGRAANFLTKPFPLNSPLNADVQVSG